MKQFAFVNNQGEIVHVMSPGRDEDYIHGQQYGEYIAYEVSSDTDPSTYISTSYYKNGELKNKPAKPNVHHNWDLATESWILDSSRLFAALREARDSNLLASDWTQIPDAPLTAEQKTAWQTYRQALRDIPANNADITDLDQVVWPTQPSQN